jgi:hypothetical protein
MASLRAVLDIRGDPAGTIGAGRMNLPLRASPTMCLALRGADLKAPLEAIYQPRAVLDPRFGNTVPIEISGDSVFWPKGSGL